jgi:hypothetical protein
MSWSTEAPKVPGYYWFRWGNIPAEIIEITDGNWGSHADRVQRMGSGYRIPTYELIGEYWDVPITPPDEVKV